MSNWIQISKKNHTPLRLVSFSFCFIYVKYYLWGYRSVTWNSIFIVESENNVTIGHKIPFTIYILYFTGNTKYLFFDFEHRMCFGIFVALNLFRFRCVFFFRVCEKIYWVEFAMACPFGMIHIKYLCLFSITYLYFSTRIRYYADIFMYFLVHRVGWQ